MNKDFLCPKDSFKKEAYEYFVITGSIGAHHSVFSVFGVVDNKKFETIARMREDTVNIGKTSKILDEIIKFVSQEYDIEINRCCIAGSGPVSRRRGYIKLTNQDFEINVQEIMDNTTLNKVILVNDFEAMGYGLDFLDIGKDTLKLEHVGEDMTGAWTRENVYAIMGASTGLGVAITFYNTKLHLHVPLPSEGGHMDFAVHDEFDLSFVKYLRENVLTKKDVHPEFERVLSGDGIVNMYNFLKTTSDFVETDITKRIDEAKDDEEKLQTIERNYSKDANCKLILDRIVDYYARAARILSLTSECYSGLFLTGKIVENNEQLFKSGEFMRQFESHDKRSDVLRKVPVYIIKKEGVDLLGCCNVATNFFNLV